MSFCEAYTGPGADPIFLVGVMVSAAARAYTGSGSNAPGQGGFAPLKLTIFRTLKAF